MVDKPKEPDKYSFYHRSNIILDMISKQIKYSEKPNSAFIDKIYKLRKKITLTKMERLVFSSRENIISQWVLLKELNVDMGNPSLGNVFLRDNEKILHFQQQIKIRKNDIWLPDNNVALTKNISDSWFNLDIYKSDTKQSYKGKFKSKKFTNTIRSIKIHINFTEEQKHIIKRWIDAYTIMYNTTLRFIKKHKNKYKRFLDNWQNIRTYHLSEIRDKIQCESQSSKLNRNTKIVTHVLDNAIQLACSNYKSALTNFRNGNIKKFRIRYWKQNYKAVNFRRSIGIEKGYFDDNRSSFCYSIFGNIECTHDGKPFNLSTIKTKYKTTCTLEYKNKKYSLHIPEHLESKKIDNRNKVISLDPGIRCFMTGLSENSVIKICSNIRDKVEKVLLDIDEMKRKHCKKKAIRNKEKRTNKKLGNLVDEMHWKTINYLTKNYDTIVIGDLNTKSIVSNTVSKNRISAMTKRLAYLMKLFAFRQRLQYKCALNRVKLFVIDESYTSKICSYCGYYDKKLGGKTVYNCKSCKKVIDRDINGCRGIFIKSQYK